MQNFSMLFKFIMIRIMGFDDLIEKVQFWISQGSVILFQCVDGQGHEQTHT